jgi:hypothetical protein
LFLSLPLLKQQRIKPKQDLSKKNAGDGEDVCNTPADRNERGKRQIVCWFIIGKA